MSNEFVEVNIDYATDEPIWKIVLLYIFTLGLYSIFWFYMNMRFINFVKKKDDPSPLLAIFWGIPLIPYYTFYSLLDIFYPDEKKLNHIKTFFLTLLCLITYAYKLQVPYCLISNFAFISLIIMQIEINKYIYKVIHNRKEYS